MAPSVAEAKPGDALDAPGTPQDALGALYFTPVNSPAKGATKSATKRKTPTVKAEHDDSDDMNLESPTKKGKMAGKKKDSKRATPKSKDELTREDAMLLRMANDGIGFKDIRQAWLDMTGDEVTVNMLRKRHKRLKTNITDVEPEHRKAFYVALDEITTAIEKEIRDLQLKKWFRVAQAMEENGASKYEPLTLEKFFKKHGDSLKATLSGENADDHVKSMKSEDGDE